MKISLPLIKLIDKTVIPISDSSTDALIPVVLFILFLFALYGAFFIKEYSRLWKYRKIIQTISLFFFFHFFHQCFCLLRDWVYGFKKLGIDNIFAFYNLIIPVMTISFSLIFGRIFCGFLCPFGYLLELIGKLGVSVKKNIQNKKNIVLLNWILWFVSLVTGIWLFTKMSPEKRYIVENIAAIWAIIHLFIIGIKLYKPDLDTSRFKWYSTALYIPLAIIGVYTSNPWCPVVSNEVDYSAIVAFVIVLSGSIIIPQSFCRFICPLGGMITIFSSISFFKRRKNSVKLSSHVCPVGAIQNNEIISFECNLCGKCEGKNHFVINETVKIREKPCS